MKNEQIEIINCGFIPETFLKDQEESALKTIREKVDLAPLLEQSKEVQIKDESTAKQALSMAMQARKMRKTVEGTKSLVLRPHIDFQRAMNKEAKKYAEQLQEIEDGLSEKLLDWTEAEQLFSGDDEVEIEVGDGTLKTSKSWSYEVEDLNRVPLEFMQINEKKLKEYIKDGARNIPGIRIYQKNTLTMRIKND